MLVDEIFKKIIEQNKNTEFMSTGITKLDRELDGGFTKKEIIILGAFTGVGKSLFAGQALFTIASQGFQTAYFSLEISNEMIVSRLIGQIANIKPTRVLHGLLELEEYDKRIDAKSDLLVYGNCMQFYDDKYYLEDIIKIIKENQFEFIVIDFIQNILTKTSQNEYERLSIIAVELQRLAKEMNCCILVLSQLSNKVGRDGSKIIEYKGSGGIAMVADLGFILERENPVFDFNGNPVGAQLVKLHLKKNRRGIPGAFWELEYLHPGGKIIEKNY